MNLRNIAYFFIATISMVIVLIYGKNLLIPFIFALLLWFTVREIRAQIDRVTVIRERFPSWAKNLITSLFILGVLGFSSRIISSSINTLAKSHKKYESNIDSIMGSVNETLNIDLMEILKGHSGDLDFGTLLSSIFNSLTDILSSTFMIVIYTMFIFLEEAYFRTKLANVFHEKSRFDKVSTMIDRIENSVAKYLGIKTLMSLITGVLSYIVLAIIGIDSPVFWAFLIFLLNFIPTIGSLIGTIFPAIFCLLQFGEIFPSAMVLIFVGTIQIVIGNVLEPKLMGNFMNLSALVTIIALSFWGAVWGVTGMILSIPITVIMVIVFSQIPSTRSIAIMLSEKGKIE